ncbi:MAG: 60S ribosomal protein L24 [Pycnora praestabilis]|nr:MAG: 60S ribosomal protein L24 [Pycnora praestabilis]
MPFTEGQALMKQHEVESTTSEDVNDNLKFMKYMCVLVTTFIALWFYLVFKMAERFNREAAKPMISNDFDFGFDAQFEAMEESFEECRKLQSKGKGKEVENDDEVASEQFTSATPGDWYGISKDNLTPTGRSFYPDHSHFTKVPARKPVPSYVTVIGEPAPPEPQTMFVALARQGPDLEDLRHTLRPLPSDSIMHARGYNINDRNARSDKLQLTTGSQPTTTSLNEDSFDVDPTIQGDRVNTLGLTTPPAANLKPRLNKEGGEGEHVGHPAKDKLTDSTSHEIEGIPMEKGFEAVKLDEKPKKASKLKKGKKKAGSIEFVESPPLSSEQAGNEDQESSSAMTEVDLALARLMVMTGEDLTGSRGRDLVAHAGNARATPSTENVASAGSATAAGIMAEDRLFWESRSGTSMAGEAMTGNNKATEEHSEKLVKNKSKGKGKKSKQKAATKNAVGTQENQSGNIDYVALKSHDPTSDEATHCIVTCSKDFGKQIDNHDRQLVSAIVNMRTYEDTFSGQKIYPGKGKLYVRGDSKIFRFQNGKTESLFLQRKNPRRIAWTVLFRRQHKKGISEEVAKKRSRRTVKHQRAIVGASLDVIKERRSQRPEARAAARQAAIKEGKDKKTESESKKKAEKAKSAAGAAKGQTSRIQSKLGAKGAPNKVTPKSR